MLSIEASRPVRINIDEKPAFLNDLALPGVREQSETASWMSPAELVEKIQFCTSQQRVSALHFDSLGRPYEEMKFSGGRYHMNAPMFASPGVLFTKRHGLNEMLYDMTNCPDHPQLHRAFLETHRSGLDIHFGSPLRTASPLSNGHNPEVGIYKFELTISKNALDAFAAYFQTASDSDRAVVVGQIIESTFPQVGLVQEPMQMTYRPIEVFAPREVLVIPTGFNPDPYPARPA